MLIGSWSSLSGTLLLSRAKVFLVKPEMFDNQRIRAVLHQQKPARAPAAADAERRRVRDGRACRRPRQGARRPRSRRLTVA